MNNLLLRTDVYKMGHLEQTCPGTNKVYSYYCNRTDQYFEEHIFFGLQYYLKKYLTKEITVEMGVEFLKRQEQVLGRPPSAVVVEKINALCELGYLPIEIKSLPEGTSTKKGLPIYTLTNTVDGFGWVVGLVESLILKTWYPSVVATASYKYRKLVNKVFEKAVDGEADFLRDFSVHDFGYRGDQTEEGAGISGAAHLLNFIGSDTVIAYSFLEDYYNVKDGETVMASVPASEHSVACSFGKEGELDYFKNMFKVYPEGIISIVSDQYDVYKVFTEYLEILKDTILERDGKTVFRPDSGNQEHIICGDPEAEEGSNEWLGCIRLLDKAFGHTINSKGYKVLNPKVGLIYGDGMYYERYERCLNRLMDMGYSPENLVIGIGGILRNHSRDVLGVAIKSTYVEVNGVPRNIFKDPITDPGKKSMKGLLKVNPDFSVDQEVSWEQEAESILQPVFRDGKLLVDQTLEEIRERIKIQA